MWLRLVKIDPISHLNEEKKRRRGGGGKSRKIKVGKKWDKKKIN